MGREYRIEIGSTENFIDMLFYHIRPVSYTHLAVLPDDTFGVSWNREAVETEMQEIDLNIRQIQVNGIVPVSYTHLDVYKRQP